MIPETLGDKHRKELELLALRLDLYGSTAADRYVIRRLSNSHLWLEVYLLLREHGFDKGEISELMGTKHRTGCACWKCVLGLNAWVRKTQREMRKRAAIRRRPLV